MGALSRALAAGVVLAIAIAGCGGGDSGSLQVSIADVLQKPDVYVQDRITTSGRVVRLSGGRNAYGLKDDSGNTIALSPSRLAATRAGREASVSGVFVLDLGTRPLIEAVSIRPVDG